MPHDRNDPRRYRIDRGGSGARARHILRADNSELPDEFDRVAQVSLCGIVHTRGAWTPAARSQVAVWHELGELPIGHGHYCGRCERSAAARVARGEH